MPSWPGSTATMPPPTPLLAGSPTALTQSPVASYIPQVTITLRVRRTTFASMTRRPVNGLNPPRASVAAIRARSVLVTLTEHWRKYTSRTSSGSPSSTPKLVNMYAIARLRLPVAFSEAYTSMSISSRRPAHAE